MACSSSFCFYFILVCVVLQKKSSELKAPDLLTKDKTGFNDELSALNNEIKKMKEEFQPILKPLKDW